MKKFLVVLLAMAMIFAFATTAFAADKAIPDYSDVKADSEFAGDIYRLTALGVLEGNNGWGGAYRPTEYLTRAEFAKIAVYMYGAEDTVNYYASLKSSFADVAEGFWAEGYINAALDMGLMKGRGNGVFDPQSTVTTQEVATVVLRAVGYTDELPGVWPADYIAKAGKVKAQWSDETLFDYVDFIGPNAATRAEMAAIVNYALDLYKVTYVAGNYTLVYGVSDVDADGYAYDTMKTNEIDMFEYMLGVDVDVKGNITLSSDKGIDYDVTVKVDPKATTKVTMLWNVFNAVEVPTLFEFWGNDLAESAGWGYTDDFEDRELVLATEIHDFDLPVASNYYIFDETMDGELWNLAGRVGMLTVLVDNDLEDSEVAFVEMMTDVEYVTDGDKVGGKKIYNGNVYSLDMDGFWGKVIGDVDDYVYDFDNFIDLPFGIVTDVEEDLVALDDKTMAENGVFCLMDDCKKHDLEFVIVKDGVLGDASMLEVNDIVYFAGKLEGDVELYLAYSPVEATLEQLDATANSGIGVMTISGTEYNYKEATQGALMSDDNGDSFQTLDYDYLRAILKDEDDDASVLFAEAYAKTFVGELIFDYIADKTTYGVIVDLDTKVKNNNGAVKEVYTAITFMGADGEEVTFDLDEEVVCTTAADKAAVEKQFKLGDLVTYVVDDDEVVVDSIGLKTSGRYDGYKVAFAPQALNNEMDINAKGVFRNNMQAYATYVNGVAVSQNYKGYSISDDTVVFVVSTKNSGKSFDEVEIGKAADYMDTDTYVAQYGILDPADKTVEVMYIVDPDTTVTTGYGLMTGHYTVKSTEYVVIDGVTYELELDNAHLLEDDVAYYVGYTIEKGKVTVLRYGQNNYGDKVKKGDLVVLVDEFGYGFNDGTKGDFDQVEAILAGIVDDYENVAYITDRDDLEDFDFADDCKSYDMTEEHPGRHDDYSFDLDDIDHDEDAFDYIVIYNDYNEVAMIFAVNFAG